MTAKTQASTLTADSLARANPEFLESIDAASGKVIAQIPATPPESVPNLMAQARQAQETWAAKSVRQRCTYLRKIRDAIYEQRDAVTNAISLETGKPHVEAVYAELLLALDTADFLARQAPEWLRPEPVPHHNIGVKAKSGSLHFQPYGVLGIISPWNYPFSIPMAQILPALVAGNAVLVKPSELTPQVGQVIAEVISAAEIPPGLVQVCKAEARSVPR